MKELQRKVTEREKQIAALRKREDELDAIIGQKSSQVPLSVHIN